MKRWYLVVLLLSRIQLFATPWAAAHLPFTISNSCPLSWWCHPTMSSSVVLFSSCLQSFPASGSFPMVAKIWSFSFSISSSNEYSGLISFRINGFDLLAVQQTLKSLLQHHNSKASILRGSAFLMVQLSHSYMSMGKTIALTNYIDICWQSVVSAF